MALEFIMRGKLISVTNFMAIHPVAVEIFHQKKPQKCQPRGVTTGKSGDHRCPLVQTKVSQQVLDGLSCSLRLTDIAIYKVAPLACLKALSLRLTSGIAALNCRFPHSGQIFPFSNLTPSSKIQLLKFMR